jgi:hypothetical protein
LRRLEDEPGLTAQRSPYRLRMSRIRYDREIAMSTASLAVNANALVCGRLPGLPGARPGAVLAAAKRPTPGRTEEPVIGNGHSAPGMRNHRGDTTPTPFTR